MRTEQEIRDRIHEMESSMSIAITKYYSEECSEESFKRVYSNIWNDMKALYWVLGMTPIEATNFVAVKVMRMCDEIEAAMTEIKL